MTNQVEQESIEHEQELVGTFADECGYYEIDPKAAISFLDLYLALCQFSMKSLRGGEDLIALIDSYGMSPAEALKIIKAQDWEGFFDQHEDFISIPAFNFEAGLEQTMSTAN